MIYGIMCIEIRLGNFSEVDHATLGQLFGLLGNDACRLGFFQVVEMLGNCLGRKLGVTLDLLRTCFRLTLSLLNFTRGLGSSERT
jgi:hypothetical protein